MNRPLSLLRAAFRVPGTWTSVGEQRRAETLHIAHVFVFLGSVIYFLVPQSVLAGQEVFIAASMVYALIGSLLLRLGYLTASSHWTILIMWAIFAFGSFTEGGITSSSFAGTLAMVVFAGLIFGLRGAFALAGASIVTGGLSVYLLAHGLLPPPAIVYTPANIFSDFVIYLLFTALFTGRAISSIDSTTKRFEAELQQRRRAEEIISESLREKEAMLKEIHHRVKNNLQVISSLLSLQGTDLSNAPEAFRESQNRIKSMALIHERLYRSESLAGVDFDDYLHSIVDQLVYSYGKRSVRADVDARGIVLEIDKAIPCGLIVNELVSNALKHGFPGERGGVITIRMTGDHGGSSTLVVSDDGVGMPPGSNPREATTLGLTIVRGLTEQLKGTLEVDSNPGACFTIRFPSA